MLPRSPQTEAPVSVPMSGEAILKNNKYEKNNNNIN